MTGVLQSLFIHMHTVEIHKHFVLQSCVAAVERVRVAIDIKIDLSCQKIYL